jgi:hypothetical protein
MELKLTAEEIKRYAPYHLMDAFMNGFGDYESGKDESHLHEGIHGRAYDLGAECASRRAEIRRREETHC